MLKKDEQSDTIELMW